MASSAALLGRMWLYFFVGALLCSWAVAGPGPGLPLVYTLVFFTLDAHFGLVLVQLEFLSLLALGLALLSASGKLSALFVSLLCLMVGEAALGLALLVLNSRSLSREFHKFSL